jgi:hypothetical protein
MIFDPCPTCGAAVADIDIETVTPEEQVGGVVMTGATVITARTLIPCGHFVDYVCFADGRVSYTVPA